MKMKKTNQVSTSINFCIKVDEKNTFKLKIEINEFNYFYKIQTDT